MILPDKYVTTPYSLLGQSALLLKVRQDGMTVSDLWTAVQGSISYERFLLALDFLFVVGAVDVDRGMLRWSS